MPLLNTLKSEGDDARAALDSRESLLALGPATVAYGVTTGPPGAEADVDATRERVGRGVAAFSEATFRAEEGSRARSGFVRVLLAPLALFGAGPSVDPGNFPESWIGGRTCEGPGGSAARDVQRVVKSSNDAYVAVTDNRLVLLTRTKSGGGMSAVWAVPRSVVASARHRPRLFARARFELRFTDGSWIVLSGWSPHIGSWHAKQIAASLKR
jgi:hypothetical protein